MRTPQIEIFPPLTPEETSWPAVTQDSGPTETRTTNPELFFAQHKSLKRKTTRKCNHKKKTNHSRKNKSTEAKCDENEKSPSPEHESVKPKQGQKHANIRKDIDQSCGDNANKAKQDKDQSLVFSDTEDETPTLEVPPAEVSPGDTSAVGTSGLSQSRSYCRWSDATSDSDEETYESERSSIEEQIRKKCIEMQRLMEITAKRFRRSRRLQRLIDGESDDYVPEYVNVQPIRRRKRTAQPIRNALLIRSSMKKAWKGSLNGCCGKGCWASWKWMNLKRVISDYE